MARYVFSLIRLEKIFFQSYVFKAGKTLGNRYSCITERNVNSLENNLAIFMQN